ncbi:MAG TPA: hypothetical protein ENI18_05145 [Candidatus Aminicenantes bacterium]|nr:hypothetical protein [Candidatus Aminicenantes bacterium]
MKNRLSIGELFEVLETEIDLLTDKTDGDENIGKIKAVSLMLEERVDELYRQTKCKKKKQEKPEIMESGTETCVCGQPWVYEDTAICQVIGRCRDEYCFVNVKRQT